MILYRPVSPKSVTGMIPKVGSRSECQTAPFDMFSISTEAFSVLERTVTMTVSNIF